MPVSAAVPQARGDLDPLEGEGHREDRRPLPGAEVAPRRPENQDRDGGDPVRRQEPRRRAHAAQDRGNPQGRPGPADVAGQSAGTARAHAFHEERWYHRGSARRSRARDGWRAGAPAPPARARGAPRPRSPRMDRLDQHLPSEQIRESAAAGGVDAGGDARGQHASPQDSERHAARGAMAHEA